MKKKATKLDITRKKKAVKLGPCNCVDQVNEELSKSGQMLDSCMVIDFETGITHVAGPLIKTTWIDKPIRGKKLSTMICSYCPVCGKKLPRLK